VGEQDKDNSFKVMLKEMIPWNQILNVIAQFLISSLWEKPVLGNKSQCKETTTPALQCPKMGTKQSILTRDSFIRDSFTEDALLSAWD